MDVEAGFASSKDITEHRSGLSITFKDLTYTVDSNVEKGKKVTLLSNVSGYFQPNQMTALMGPSGSGKTTLLDTLAGRKTVGSIKGDIRFGGVAPSPAFLRRYTGYVEQFDTLIGSLTVQEMLLYTAELKRPRSEPYSSKTAAVSRLLDELGLTPCKDVRIGDTLVKGISGGQAKRTNIGIALISDPRVLFLDEPTSGLDSFSADEVVSLIKRLSQSGVTVVATIHSPSSYAFAMFDRVLLLARGFTTYFGPQGEALLSFAKQQWPIGFSQREGASMPELVMGMVTEADRSGDTQLLADAYAKSGLRQENDAKLDSLLSASMAPTRSNTSRSLACRAYVKLTGKPCKSETEASMGANTSIKAPHAVDQAAAVGTVAALPADGDTASLSSKASTPGVSHSFGNPQLQAVDSTQDVKGAAGAITLASTPASMYAESAAALQSMLMDAQLAAQLNTRSSTSTPWWWGLWVLLKYRARVNYTNPAWVLPRTADKFLFSFIILTLYLTTGDDYSSSNLVNLGASLFMWTTLPAFGAVAYVPSIVLERRLFLRERADGLYHVATYLAAKLIEEIVLATIISIIFSSYVFYGVQYQRSFLLFWIVYLLVLSNGIALGYLVAAVSPNLDVANAALPAYVTTLLFFAGQLATYDSIPAYWRWYSRIDFVRYSWTALMVNQFESNDPPFATDDQSTLEYFGMAGEDKWANTAYLLIFFAVFATLGYLALSYVNHAKR